AFVQVDIHPDDKNEIQSSIVLPEEHTLYALSAPVDTIHSLLVQAPSFSRWYGHIVINFKEGPSAGPFWFHDDESKSTMLQKNTQGGKFVGNTQQVRWGGDEFIDRLGQLVPVHTSETDYLYLVGHGNTSPALFAATQMDPFVATLKEARWNILEKLSRVTKFSRDTAVNLLSKPATRPLVPLFPTHVQEMCHQNETVKQTVDDYDSARIFLAKWAAGLAAQSSHTVPKDQKYRHVGVWGHDGWEEDTALGVFEILNSENDVSIPTHTRTTPVTSAEWHSYFDQKGRLLVDLEIVKKHIFSGGLDMRIRKQAWLFLTGVYAWDSDTQERQRIDQEKSKHYLDLKHQWFNNASLRETSEWQDQKHRIDKDVHRTDRTVDIYMNQDLDTPNMQSGSNHHLETLKHILCTYNVFNTELGYVQGMSDLLSPLYAVIEDEALAFWAFVGFMERMKSNFYTDQSGMHQQLLTMDLLLQFMDPSLYKHFERTDSGNFFFCFRWLLVWFKREFTWKDMLVLWEVLWTDYLTDKFHLFVALSILDQHRDVMMEYLKNFDEILKYTNDLSMTIDLQETLQRAEILYYQFKQRMEAVESKRQSGSTVKLP
ncbi:GTPase activating protein, partial [Rhizopus stolonifer]